VKALRQLTLEQWCGFSCGAILGVICYGFDAVAFPWWLKTIVVLFTAVAALMILNFRLTYLSVRVRGKRRTWRSAEYKRDHPDDLGQ
jgi:hypothetical protein